MSKFLNLPVIEIRENGILTINGVIIDGVRSFKVSEDCDDKDYCPGLAECTITFKCQKLVINRGIPTGNRQLKDEIEGAK